MTGTEPHAPRGTAGSGPNYDSGPRGVHGPRQSCTALYEAAPPAMGSTETIGSALAAGATRRRMHISAPPAVRPYGDRWPQAGWRSCSTRSGSYALSHAHLGTAGRETILGARAASGPEELRDSERPYASTHAYLGTAGRGTRKGTVGCERIGRAA
jgi:hypothetical protein